MTLTQPPARPGPSPSRVKVARRRSGGQGEGERGCSGHRASTGDVGCHGNRWGGVPRRGEEEGAQCERSGKRRGATGAEGGDCGGGERREKYAQVIGARA